MRTLRGLFVLGSIGSVVQVHAGGTRIYSQDAEGMSLCNAFAATADNPSAIYYNPAGITQLEGQNFRAGGMPTLYRWDYTSPAGASFSTVSHLRATAQFYCTDSLESLPLSIGFGTYTPYGLGQHWPDNVPFRTLGTRAEILYVSCNPVIAWKVTDRLSVAAGPTLNYSSAEFKEGLVVPGDEFRFIGNGFAPGFNAGLFWRISEHHTIGLKYRSETSVNFIGHTTVENLSPQIPVLPPSGQSSAHLELVFPQDAGFGWSFHPTADWNFEFDLNWTDWDQLNTEYLVRGSTRTPEVFNWRSSFDFVGGVTHNFKQGYKLSFGGGFSQYAATDAHYSPFVPDLDGVIYSLGFGHQSEHWSWYASYQGFCGLSRTVEGSAHSAIGQSADGKYTALAHFLALSASYQF